MNPESYLQILELSLPLTSDELKQAYKKLISKWHPDKFTNLSEISYATKKAQEINVAYEALSEYIEQESEWETNTNYSPRHFYSGKIFTTGFPDANAFECFLKSSNIISIGYNYILKTLYVKFHSNVVYAYFEVPQRVFEGFLTAPSPGKYRNQIVNHYRYERCLKPNVPYQGNRLT